MSNRKRSLAGFDSVASDNNNKSNIESDNTINNNNDSNNDSDIIAGILGDKKQVKSFVGIYFDPDLAEALDRVAGGKKGAKSALVNEALRQLFQKEGLI